MSAFCWPKNEWKWWYLTIMWKINHSIYFKLSVYIVVCESSLQKSLDLGQSLINPTMNMNPDDDGHTMLIFTLCCPIPCLAFCICQGLSHFSAMATQSSWYATDGHGKSTSLFISCNGMGAGWQGSSNFLDKGKAMEFGWGLKSGKGQRPGQKIGIWLLGTIGLHF